MTCPQTMVGRYTLAGGASGGSDWPLVHPAQGAYGGGTWDAVVARFTFTGDKPDAPTGLQVK
jgi:hypothetical protein